MHPEVLLHLLQVSDTAFPTGSFSHSMGLEAFAEAGELKNAEDLRRVVEMHLSSLATSDCVALRTAYAAGSEERLMEVDRLLSATKLSREMRSASTATGKRFLANMKTFGVRSGPLQDFAQAVEKGASPGNLAVGWGAAAPPLGFGVSEALLSYLYSASASFVAAGQKLVPLGQSAAQKLLFDLSGKIDEAMNKSKEIEMDSIYSFVPLLDVRSMLHERQRVRLYIS